MGKLQFCERFVYLDGLPISFAERPYLPAIYAVENRNLVLRSSRQTEKSTFLVNQILNTACRRPRSKILFVSPRQEQALLFARTRLLGFARTKSPAATCVARPARTPTASDHDGVLQRLHGLHPRSVS